ncbi:MAG: VOC family protein [Candidatus Poribacteria bacterium]|nr:VOC family protein [Candidatus Poribacteria bacterium]
MSNPVVHFEIGGKDIEKLIDFYSSVFEWGISQLTEDIYIADPRSDEGIEGHLFQINKDDNFSNLVLIYVDVDDIWGCLEQVENLGGKIIIQPQEIPGNVSHYALFNDPSGNSIGLLQRRLS